MGLIMRLGGVYETEAIHSLAICLICTSGVAFRISRSTQKLNILQITASSRLA